MTYTGCVSDTWPRQCTLNTRRPSIFAQWVEKESNGRIKCSTHPQGQLGSHIQMLEALPGGCSGNGFGGRSGHDLNSCLNRALLSQAFIFNSPDEMYALLDSPVGKKISDAFPEKGLYCGAVADHGMKAFLNRKGPVTKLEDMGQYKWRVIPNELFLDNYKAMGASPITLTLPWPEVFSALQRGVIDGIDITANECWGAKVYEAIKYMSMCKLGLNPQIYVASKKWLDSLPEDLRQIVIKGMKEAAKWHVAKIREEDSTVVIPDLKQKGIIINEISPEELARFRTAVEPVHKKWREKIGPELYDEAMAFLAEYRKK